MKLIILHGPPASGKYTIAKEIAERTGARVFHNHLTIDVAKSLFDFGTEDFWKFVCQLRLTCIKAVAEHDSGIVIYTCCYDHPSDLDFIKNVEDVLTKAGAELLPVYLKCSPSELERRISLPSRIEMGKIRSIEGLHKHLDKWNCIAIPHDNCITVATENKEVTACVEEIIDGLGLSR